jgi:hypothetical protein
MAHKRPPSGSMVWWRPNSSVEWRFGYCTYVSGPGTVRMGRWNGDTTGGVVVDVWDIEWKHR